MIYIGIDLGGTNIAVGAVDESGKIIGEFSTKTFAQRPYQDIIRDMAFCFFNDNGLHRHRGFIV